MTLYLNYLIVKNLGSFCGVNSVVYVTCQYHQYCCWHWRIGFTPLLLCTSPLAPFQNPPSAAKKSSPWRRLGIDTCTEEKTMMIPIRYYCLELPPSLPGTVTTRTTFLVGNPYKPSCSSYWVGGRFKVLYVVIMKYAWNALGNIQCTMIIQMQTMLKDI